MQNHSEFITKDTITTLLQYQEDVSISLFLPTHRSGKEIQQNPIRFKNLLSQAQEQAEALGIRDPQLRELCQPAWKLVEETPFWQHQQNGLAAFLTSKHFYFYRLPLQFEPVAVVSDSFHLKPLFPLISENSRFYILALSQKQVRLFQAHHYGPIRQLELEGMPDSVDDMMADEEREKDMQTHSGSRVGSSREKEAAVFHGQGAGTDEANAKRLQFFHQVDKAVYEQLHGEHAPLMLAGVESLFPLYRQANTYPHLVEQRIPGNPDDVRAEELHEQAIQILRPELLKEREKAIVRYRQLAANGDEKISQRVREVVPAAYYGRIDTLFVALGMQQWGTFEKETDTAHLHDEQHPGDGDLLNDAAVQTLTHGGTVYALSPEDIPEKGITAAIFRH